MKGSILEPVADQIHFGDAQVLFLTGLNGMLDSAAFGELRELAKRDSQHDAEEAEVWAKKWHVNAPFVVNGAREIVEAVRRDPAAPGRFVVSRHDSVPEVWHHRIAALNELSVEFLWLDDGVASGTMRTPSEHTPGVFETIAAPRHRLLEQDHVLAPIATDPSRESQEAFVERARHHWEGRAQLARRDGLTPVAPRPELRSHTEWLLKYQLGLVSLEDIAGQARATRDAVRRAITRLAKLLRLDIRKGKSGRPRRPHA
jgi:hypothetical protein